MPRSSIKRNPFPFVTISCYSIFECSCECTIHRCCAIVHGICRTVRYGSYTYGLLPLVCEAFRVGFGVCNLTPPKPSRSPSGPTIRFSQFKQRGCSRAGQKKQTPFYDTRSIEQRRGYPSVACSEYQVTVSSSIPLRMQLRDCSYNHRSSVSNSIRVILLNTVSEIVPHGPTTRTKAINLGAWALNFGSVLFLLLSQLSTVSG
jgi:hypothetical protein